MSPAKAQCSAEEETSDFNARPYQNEILKSCIERNTIVYLPTGAGKTFIAIMALNRFSKDLEKPLAEGGKRAFFLSKTKELAYQHSEMIKRHTPFDVKLVTGDDQPDDWSEEKYMEELDKYQVIVATVGVVKNAVYDYKYWKISDMNLIVFDECHNAHGNDPMVILMRTFDWSKEDELPRVIGLSGSLAEPKVNKNKLIRNLNNLESIFHAKITTARGEAFSDVILHSTCPHESLCPYKRDSNISQELSEYLSEKWACINKLINASGDSLSSKETDDGFKIDKEKQPKFKKICSDFFETTYELGLYGGKEANLAAQLELNSAKCGAKTNAEKTIIRALITIFEELRHVIIEKLYNTVETTNDEENLTDDPETILLNSSDQVQCLLKYFEKFQKQNQSMKGLIFVKTRNTACTLSKVIERYAKTRPDLNIHVNFMFSWNSTSSADTIKNMKQVLRQFKQGKINLIVCTNVLEEGIDLPECNLVICFDQIRNYGQYVQKRGRARMQKSRFLIMVPDDKKREIEVEMEQWRNTINELKKYLTSRNAKLERPQISIDLTTKQRYNKTYPETTEGPIVDYFTAIAKLKQYCASLPRDAFTDPALFEWKEELIDDSFRVTLRLPFQSPFKDEIIGELMPSLELAKCSAAFESIKKLHEIEELSDDLRPIKGNFELKFGKIYTEWWGEFENEKSGVAGTKKHYRMHDIQIPKALCGSMPQVNCLCYLYEFLIEPHFQAPEHDESIKVFHKLLRSERSYGILTRNKLPRMGSMKFYQSFGQINCRISETPIEITLNDVRKLNELKRFHCILFQNVLDIWTEFLVYDSKDSVMIVPTNNNQIDWKIVENFQTWSHLQTKSVTERTNVIYRQEDWLNTVVCPWYRVNQSERYIVTSIPKGETPLSPFPTPRYNNYKVYSESKYKDNIERIVDDRQFLLDVKGITRELNLLQPTRESTNSIKLIPELCHNFRYPGDLWLKAIVLPSALHRMNYILHAESIRIQINDYVGLQIDNYEPMEVLGEMAKKKPKVNKAPSQDSDNIKQMTLNDIVPYDEYNDELTPGEVLGPNHNFDNIHEIDIEYIYRIISEELNNISIEISPKFGIPAICDAHEEDKSRIDILNMKNATRGIEQHEMLAALTSASSGDVFHNERFEVLGDAFLKFSVSLYLVQKHVDWHEGYLTTIKGKIIGNRNLCYSAIHKNWPGMMNVHQFVPKHDWQPPMLKVSDEIQNAMNQLNISPNLLINLIVSDEEREKNRLNPETSAKFFTLFDDEKTIDDKSASMRCFLGKQRVSDKSCADTIEAILGCCVKNIGIERSFKVLEMLNILPSNGIDISQMLHEKLKSPRIRTNISDPEVDCILINPKKLENSIGYTFKDRAYLLQALTHPSYPTNRVTGCYQQLEFLGDAILDFLITGYIFERCPYMDPGQLTDLRSALVNNVTLACLCVRHKIHVHILSENFLLAESINRFVDFQSKHNHQVGDHVELLMDEEDVCQQAEYTDVPKTLGDVFEAIIGGIFLDSGNDLELTFKVIYGLMKGELDKFMSDVPINLVRQLYEHKFAEPKFEKSQVENDRTSISLRFYCYKMNEENGSVRKERLEVKGFGANTKNAKRAAAKLALSILKQNEPFKN